MVMRSPIYIRLVSSQHSILDSSSTTTKTQEVGNDHAILDLVQRVLGSRKRDIWNKVYQRVDDVKGKKRRLGVLDLSRTHKSSLIEAFVGGSGTDPLVHQALESRWASLPESSSRLIIRNGEKVARFGSILEVPSDNLAKLNAEILEVKDLEHAAELVRAHLPVLIVDPNVNSYLPTLKHKNPIILLHRTNMQANQSLQHGQHLRSITFDRENPQEAASQLYKMLSNINIDPSPHYTKQATIRGMLDECSAQLQSSTHKLSNIRSKSADFQEKQRSLLEQLKAKFAAINLPSELQDNKAHLHNRISSFGRFRFWDMDEFSEELQVYVVANYGVELERKLEYLAGSMAVIQERIRQLTEEYLAQAAEDLDSSTLVNKIHRMEASELPVPPSCFTAPILHRRRQLVSVATPHMQKLYLRRIYAAMMAMPVVTGAPTLLWANDILDASFALPSAILGLLLCVRHISKAWEKGRSKWLADYDRIQEGLSEDIQTLVREIIDKRLRTIPSATLESSAQLIAQKEETITALAAEIEDAEKKIPS